MADPYRNIGEALDEALSRATNIAYDLVADEHGVHVDAAVSLVETIAAIRWAQDEVETMRKGVRRGT